MKQTVRNMRTGTFKKKLEKNTDIFHKKSNVVKMFVTASQRDAK